MACHFRLWLLRLSPVAPVALRLDSFDAYEENGAVVLCYRATRFIDAIYQRFAEEFAGLIQCARCPAPNCGRWFLKSAGRGDRRFCSHPCKMRAWRA